MICCETFTSIGCFNSCSKIVTGIAAAIDGEYKICYNLGVQSQCKVFYFSAGDPIDFEHFSRDAGHNEIAIFDPNGTLLGCFKFLTYLQIT